MPAIFAGGTQLFGDLRNNIYKYAQPQTGVYQNIRVIYRAGADWQSE